MDTLASVATHSDAITNWTAIAAAIAATISAIAAATMGVVNVRDAKRQRMHDRKSLIPIASIAMGDYEDRLFVTLRNDGSGPLIVETITVNRGEDEEKFSALIDAMPKKLGWGWDTFVKDIRKRAFAPGKEINLVAISGTEDDSKWVAVRERVRAALAGLVVRVTYRSAYDDKFDIERSLDWFGRSKEKTRD